MIRIEAIIRPRKLDEVKEALNEINVPGLTVLSVRGAGRQKGYDIDERPVDQAIHLREKVMVQVVVPNHLGDQVVKTIMKSAQTGQIGDGKIFVTPVIDVFRIRTEERGEAALSTSAPQSGNGLAPLHSLLRSVPSR